MSRSKPVVEDYDSADDLWRRSESPVEVWEEERDWQVSVVSEECDYWGDIRYEVQWDDWSRKDGTNQTWKSEYVDKSVLKPWKISQWKRRQKLASQAPGIAIDPSRLDLHNNSTLRRSQALEEQLRHSESHPCPWPQLLKGKRKSQATVTAEGGLSKDHIRVKPAQRKEHTRTSPRRPTATAAGYSSTDEISLDKFRPVSAKARGKRRMVDAHPSPSPLKRWKKDRQGLSKEWTSYSGCEITFINEVDEDEIPPLSADFVYLENTYVYADGVNDPSPEFLSGCEHRGKCSSAGRCECQADSQVANSAGVQAYAYDKKGLLRLDIPRGTEIIECNSNCHCDTTCPNRVAQRRRMFPLEVFKTRKHGWGVRSTSSLLKGTVLGVYTGLLIHRKSNLGNAHYSFDLDGHQNLEDNQDEEEAGYTVNSLNHGNWTRFINHSCNPNLATYLVSYNTPPNTGMYYIGFVASRQIPPGEELTVDYAPARSKEIPKSPSQAKGRTKCYCKAPRCRGYI